MGDRAYVGVLDVRCFVTARYVHTGGHEGYLPNALADIWDRTFGRDAAAMGAALVAHDWYRLDPHPAPDYTPPLRTPGEFTLVAGVGAAIRDLPRGGLVTGLLGGIRPPWATRMYLLDATDPDRVLFVDGADVPTIMSLAVVANLLAATAG